MKDFIISADSTVDLGWEYIKENNISIHPLLYSVDGEEYIPGVKDMDINEFYEGMKNGKMPVTSAANPHFIIEKFKEHVNNGYDVLHLSFSSGMSSNHNTTVLCAQEVMDEVEGSKIVVVDTLSASVGYSVLVHKAIEMKKAGKSIDEIAEWIEINKHRIIHDFVAGDLFHLYRGGRLSKSSAIFGTMLKVQPLLTVNKEGKLQPVGKVRGRKKALNYLVDNMEKKADINEIDVVYVINSNVYEEAEYVSNSIKEKYNIQNVFINDLSTTIGAHTGTGIVAVGYLAKERPI